MKIVSSAFVLQIVVHLMREVCTPLIVCLHPKSNTSSKLLERQIRLEHKRIELKAAYELMEARAQKAKALVKLRLEEARIETEQKLLNCSEKGSSVAVARRSRVLSRRDLGGSVWRTSKAGLGRDAGVLESLNELLSTTSDGQAKRLANDHCNKIAVKERTKTWVEGISDCTKNDVTVPKQIACSLGNQNMMPMQSSFDQNSAVYHYLERQGRNEYINLASQIGYNGVNIAFVFFENQIRKLMAESPHEERRLELLRALCVGQPRETVNLFLHL